MPLRRGEWESTLELLGGQGLRMLAAAAATAPADGRTGVGADDVRELTLLGLVGIADPPRAEAIEASRRCRAADIRVTMVTGDHASTATAIGAELGIAGDAAPRVVTGARVDEMSDGEQKSLMFILPTTLAQALIAVVVGFVPPLQPTQVLWVNLVTVITLSLALAYEPAEPGLTARAPRPVTGSIIDGVLLVRVVWAAVLIAAASIAVFFLEQTVGSSFAVAQTSAVTVLGQVAYLFNSRFLRQSRRAPRAFLGNRVVWISIGALIALQLAFTYFPFMQKWFHTTALTAREWGIALALSLGIFLAVEAEEALSRRIWNRHGV